MSALRPTHMPQRATTYRATGAWGSDTVWTAFAATAARRTDAIAVVDGDVRLDFAALASRAGVRVVAYEDRPTGTLAVAERKMRMTEVVLRPRITLAPGSDAVKARALVDEAHAGCFIANSVASTVRLEPEIVSAS